MWGFGVILQKHSSCQSRYETLKNPSRSMTRKAKQKSLFSAFHWHGDISIGVKTKHLMINIIHHIGCKSWNFQFKIEYNVLIDGCIVTGPGGTPRPIELHSHDPMRYVGDMLAWLHQASASEKEYVNSLLKKCTGTCMKKMCSQFVNVCNHVIFLFHMTK